MRSLLDINVLLALFDGSHEFHERAREWLTAAITDGWASCPITQNGFVRIISQPRYPNPVPTPAAIERLARACATDHHEFWPSTVSILDRTTVDPTVIRGPKQVTDICLLALAVENGGRFVTFDGRVPVSAINGASATNLMTI